MTTTRNNSPSDGLEEPVDGGEGPEVPATTDGGPLALLDRHPFLVVAVVASLVGLAHAVWIWTHRHLGAFDPDEAGYIANALRFQRSIDLGNPMAFVRTVGGTGTGPVVPLLSVPFLLAGPRDPRTAMMLQPVLLVVSALAVAGVARRLAGPRTAVAAGLVWATLPTVALATQSYWLGLGAATFAALAAWALLESDRLTNRWTYAYGACIALMAMSRTMAVAFAPALGLAGVVVAGRQRSSWWGLVKAGLVAVAMAGPWWLVNWDSLTEYLFSYGYGKRAALFGQGTVLDRVWFRLTRIGEATNLSTASDWSNPVQAVVLFTLASSAWAVVRDYRKDRTLPEGLRGGLALGLAAVAGIAALASTTNNGVWFELPVVVLLVPLTLAAASRGWWGFRLVLGAAFLAFGVWTLGRSLWLIGPGTSQPPRNAHYEDGFAQYDTRFASDRRDQLAAATADWRATNRTVFRTLAGLVPTGRPVPATVSGNMVLLNANSLALQAELDVREFRPEIPDTVRSTKERARFLTPTTTDGAGNEIERLLVLELHDKTLFTPDEKVRDFARQAGAAGWRVVESVPLPTGGRVEILRHRENL